MSKHHVFSRAAAALGVATLTTLTVSTGFADAHIKAHAPEATQGGSSKITFSVPDEQEKASTVKVEIDFPKDTPIASVDTKAIPGWHAEVTTAPLPAPVKVNNAEVKEAVTSVVWTANPGTAIAPGQFAEFDVAADALPDNTDKLVFTAIQTYDNGSVVRWDQRQAPGQPEPEHPAPEVALAKATDGDGAGAGAGQPTHGVSPAPTATPPGAATDDTARWLAGGGLAVGVLGLGVGIGATLRARKGGTTGTSGTSGTGGAA